jgi:hypothetical protein
MRPIFELLPPDYLAASEVNPALDKSDFNPVDITLPLPGALERLLSARCS